jgi:hypothetical protein
MGAAVEVRERAILSSGAMSHLAVSPLFLAPHLILLTDTLLGDAVAWCASQWGLVRLHRERRTS